MIDYKGVFTVIPTFFDDSHKVNMNQIIDCINIQKNNGINKIVILGTTSEANTLSIEEKILISKTIWKFFSNNMTIIIGIGGIFDNEIINEAKQLMDYCNAFMLSAPYYVKPQQHALINHFNTIISHFKEKDFIIYNVPSRTGVNIEPKTVLEICKSNKNVKAIKEASGILRQVIEIKELCDIEILCGDDGLLCEFLTVGASGVISVISNIAPKEVIQIVNHFKNNDLEKGNEIFSKINEIIKMAFIESNPVPIKYMLYLKYKFSQKVRKPLMELTDFHKDVLTVYFNNFI